MKGPEDDTGEYPVLKMPSASVPTKPGTVLHSLRIPFGQSTLRALLVGWHCAVAADPRNPEHSIVTTDSEETFNRLQARFNGR